MNPHIVIITSLTILEALSFLITCKIMRPQSLEETLHAFGLATLATTLILSFAPIILGAFL